MQNTRKIAIIGAGHVAHAVVAGVPPSWEVVLVDISEVALAQFPERAEGSLQRVHGDGSSRLVLARCGIGRGSVVVAATRSDEVNKEVARVAREGFGVEERVVLLDVAEGLDEAGILRAEVVARHLATASLVLNTLPLGEARASALGLGEGELLQVTVLQGSPAIGRALHSFEARDWLVAAVYRGAGLIVPHGQTTVHAGDRLLLVGDPAALRQVAAYFRGGEPTFPNLYGPMIGWMGASTGPLAEWLSAHTLARGPTEVAPARLSADAGTPDEARDRVRAQEVGCLVVPPSRVPWLARLGLRPAAHANRLFNLGLPFLVARGAPPIRRLLLALDPRQDPQPLGNVALDLARELGASLACLTVLPPRVAGGDPVPDLSVARHLSRLAILHGVVMDTIQDEGNPIERIRHHAREADLLIVGFERPTRRSTVFSPDVSLFLLHDAPVSTLFVPRARG